MNFGAWIMSDDHREMEIWFIYSPLNEEWAGLRIATFLSRPGDPEVYVIIHNEVPERTGLRIWTDIIGREGWAKVTRIDHPTPAQIMAAMKDKPHG